MSELSFKYEAFHSSYKDITWTYIYYDKAKEAMLRMNSSYHRKLYSISDILTLKYGEWKVCYICKIRGHTLKCFKNFRSIFEVTTTYICTQPFCVYAFTFTFPMPFHYMRM